MKRVILGMLTPSSNTVLEPVTTKMLEGLPDVTAHFGRFRVTEISFGFAAAGALFAALAVALALLWQPLP